MEKSKKGMARAAGRGAIIDFSFSVAVGKNMFVARCAGVAWV